MKGGFFVKFNTIDDHALTFFSSISSRLVLPLKYSNNADVHFFIPPFNCLSLQISLLAEDMFGLNFIVQHAAACLITVPIIHSDNLSVYVTRSWQLLLHYLAGRIINGLLSRLFATFPFLQRLLGLFKTLHCPLEITFLTIILKSSI